jgi:hypothetical protein
MVLVWKLLVLAGQKLQRQLPLMETGQIQVL